MDIINVNKPKTRYVGIQRFKAGRIRVEVVATSAKNARILCERQIKDTYGSSVSSQGLTIRKLS